MNFDSNVFFKGKILKKLPCNFLTLYKYALKLIFVFVIIKMRKTQLWVEKKPTPEYYDTRVTHYGNSNKIQTLIKSSNQSKAKRFQQYESDANRLGKNIGPGCYPQFYNCIYASRIKGTPIYKMFYRQRDLEDNRHFFLTHSRLRNDSFRKTF